MDEEDTVHVFVETDGPDGTPQYVPASIEELKAKWPKIWKLVQRE